jgi:hypothetical protein
MHGRFTIKMAEMAKAIHSSRSGASNSAERTHGLLHAAFAVALVILAVGCSSIDSHDAPSANKDHKVEQALKERSQTAYLFKSDGSPRFHITSSTEPEPGWYVVKFKLDDVETEEGTVVLQQQGSSDKQLNVIAGPGTAFPNQCASSVFPAAVHKTICGS